MEYNQLHLTFSYIQNFSGTKEIIPNYVQVNYSSIYSGYDEKAPIVQESSGANHWHSQNTENQWYEVFFNYN